MKFNVRVPGKVMLAGEYGVLFGEPALSVATEPFMHISLEATPAKNGFEKIVLCSDLWPQKECYTRASLNEITRSETVSPFRDSVQKSFHDFKGFDFVFTVDGSLNPQFGLGSSSALRLGVVTLAFIFSHSELNNTKDFLTLTQILRDNKTHLAFLAWKQQQLAGIQASGYDFLTQAHGGILFCQFHSFYDSKDGTPSELGNSSKWLKHCEQISSDTLKNRYQKLAHIFVHPQGGAPTVKTMRHVLSKMTAEEKLEFGAKMGKLARVTRDYLNNKNDQAFPTLSKKCRLHRKLFQNFGAAPQCFLEIDKLPERDETWTYKTTGAGGEDALLFWGDEVPIKKYVAPLLCAKGWQRLSLPCPTQGIEFVEDNL